MVDIVAALYLDSEQKKAPYDDGWCPKLKVKKYAGTASPCRQKLTQSAETIESDALHCCFFWAAAL